MQQWDLPLRRCGENNMRQLRVVNFVLSFLYVNLPTRKIYNLLGFFWAFLLKKKHKQQWDLLVKI